MTDAFQGGPRTDGPRATTTTRTAAGEPARAGGSRQQEWEDDGPTSRTPSHNDPAFLSYGVISGSG